MIGYILHLLNMRKTRKNKLAIVSNESDLCMNITHSNTTVGLDLFFPETTYELANIDVNIAIIDLNDRAISAFNIKKSKTCESVPWCAGRTIASFRTFLIYDSTQVSAFRSLGVLE